tara:strand:- start:283 stop:504 length:222 start_codon:yes stop_codon:yes gene_type:complete
MKDELNWSLNLKYTNTKPFQSCQVISVIEDEHVILDFDINNGGEFYHWHPVSGVMEKVKPKRFAVLPIVTGSY